LLCNNVIPIDESQWIKQPDETEYAFYLLLGKPHA